MNWSARIFAMVSVPLAVLTAEAGKIQAKGLAVTECPGLITESGVYVLRNDILATDSNYCFEVEVSDVTIRLNGFAVTADRVVNVPSSSPGPIINRLRIIGPGRLVGLGLHGSTLSIGANDSLIRGVTFENVFATLTITNSRIESNKFLNLSHVLLAESEDRAPFDCSNNKVRRNSFEGILALSSCDDTLIDRNVIDATSFPVGISLFGDYRVVRNEVFNAQSAGIHLDGTLEAPSHGTLIEGNSIHDNDIGIHVGPGGQEEDIEDTLVRKNRLDDNQDQILVEGFAISNTDLQMNRCDPPDNDPPCNATFAPISPAIAPAAASMAMEVPQVQQAPLLMMPLKKGKIQ